MIKFSNLSGYKTADDGKILYDYVTHVVGAGTTLYVKTESERVMSDVWEYIERAYYLDENGNISSVCTDSRDFECTIDADYDAAFAAYRKTVFDRELALARESADAMAGITAVKGRTVRVTRGRNAVGTVGKVVVIKEMVYNAGWRGRLANKLAIALDDEMTTWISPSGKSYPVHKNIVWAWAFNCEVVDPTPDYSAAARTANYNADLAVDRLKRDCKTYGKFVAETV